MTDNNPQKLWENWKQNPSRENLSATVKSMKDLIDSSASQAKGVNSSLIKSKARVLAAEAISSYDPSMGASLKTHVFNHLRPIGRESKNMTEAVPLSRHYLTGATNYTNAVNDFIQEHNREPDDVELMDSLGVNERQLSSIRRGVKYEIPETQLVGAIEQGDDADSARLNLWTEYVYNDLDPTGRKIIDMKLGRHGYTPMSNEEIAEKLKISPVDVSNRSAKIASSILQGMNVREKMINEG